MRQTRDILSKFTLQPTFPKIHNSDIAIARPPFEQSCTDFNKIFEINDKTDFIFFFDSDMFTEGAMTSIKL